MNKKIIALLGVALMLGTAFGTMILYMPSFSDGSNNPISSPVTASTISSSYSNTAYLNSTASYWHGVDLSNTGSSSFNIGISQNSSSSAYGFESSNSWGLASNDQSASWTQTFSGAPNYVYLTDANFISIPDIFFELGLYESAGHNFQELGTVYANLTVDGYTETWSYTFNFNEPADYYYAFIDPQWNFFSGTPFFTISNFASASLSVVATTDGTAYLYAPYDFATTTANAGANTILTETTTPSVVSVNMFQGYHWNQASITYSPASDLTSYSIHLSLPYSTTQVTYNGNTYTGTTDVITGSLSSFTFNVNNPISQPIGDTAGYSVTASYYLEDQVQAQQVTGYAQSFTGSQNPTQQQNWWNSTLSLTLTDPSGALNNPSLATTSGTINAETTMTWSINHILSAGYGQGAMFDTVYYHGTDITSGSYNPSSQYNSLSQSTPEVIDSSTSVSYTFDEAINFAPTLLSHNVVWTGTSDTAKVYVNVSQAGWTTEPEQLVIHWGNAASSSTTLTADATASFTSTHTYATTGTKDISFQLVNVPDSSLITAGSASVSTLPYQISITPTPTPAPYTQLKTGEPISLKFSTVHDIVSGVTLSISGSVVKAFSPDSQTGSLTANVSQAGQTAFTAVWSFDGASFSYSVLYAAPEYPTLNSPYITTMFGTNATHQFPITINSPPSGSGYYQQLITLTNPSQYGINSQASNFQIALPNGTLLYTWIQDFNSTSLTMWVKMPYGTGQVELQILPEFENVLSATGYVGKWNTTEDNGNEVFNFYQSWAGLSSLPSGWNAYGNSSDTIVTYYSNHINLRSTGDAVNNPYVAEIYKNYTPAFPISLYSYMDFYMSNPGGDQNEFGLMQSSDMLPQHTYGIFGGYGGGSSGDTGITPEMQIQDLMLQIPVCCTKYHH
uniref:AMDV3_2 n=1 Tax=uncultured virus TaxID=340016 RepID=B3GAL8_9VIRU|nr:AMDV3_2 [uncultured virus]